MPMSGSELKDVPGFAPGSQRGYCYVESPNLSAFKTFFARIRNIGATPAPRDGGMLNEEVEIRPPTGESLFAISFKGDRAGWLQVIKEYAAHHGLRFGEIDGEAIAISDGRRLPLSECDLIRY